MKIWWKWHHFLSTELIRHTDVACFTDSTYLTSHFPWCWHQLNVMVRRKPWKKQRYCRCYQSPLLCCLEMQGYSNHRNHNKFKVVGWHYSNNNNNPKLIPSFNKAITFHLVQFWSRHLWHHHHDSVMTISVWLVKTFIIKFFIKLDLMRVLNQFLNQSSPGPTFSGMVESSCDLLSHHPPWLNLMMSLYFPAISSQINVDKWLLNQCNNNKMFKRVPSC